MRRETVLELLTPFSEVCVRASLNINGHMLMTLLPSAAQKLQQLWGLCLLHLKKHTHTHILLPSLKTSYLNGTLELFKDYVNMVRVIKGDSNWLKNIKHTLRMYTVEKELEPYIRLMPVRCARLPSLNVIFSVWINKANCHLNICCHLLTFTTIV